MDRPGTMWSRRAALALLGLAATGATMSARAQQATPPTNPGAAKDFSRDGTMRRDTQVLRPKDGETVSVRLPKQGTAVIASQVPWAIIGGKESPELSVEFDPRGIKVHHTGAGQARLSINLRLLDGRKITINVRTANTKYPAGYLIIT
ncbi:MAG: hypothetical protein JO021_14795 [Alphaproteobacteria bacterium]|nr:hypothetical protein [Alphaproteobacteria bacterium]